MESRSLRAHLYKMGSFDAYDEIGVLCFYRGSGREWGAPYEGGSSAGMWGYMPNREGTAVAVTGSTQPYNTPHRFTPI